MQHYNLLPSKFPLTLNVSDEFWVLGRICSLWRSVFISLTVIWSNICIRSTDYQVYSHILLRTILDRSNGRPLTIFSYHSLPEKNSRLVLEQFEKIGEELLEMVIDHSDLWENMHLDAHPRALDQLDRAKHHLGNLKKIKLVSISGWKREHYRDPSTSLSQFLGVAPRLECVELEGFYYDTSFSLPLSQLTQYAEIGCEQWDPFHALPHLTNVVRYAFGSRSTRFPVAYPNEPILLHRLQGLQACRMSRVESDVDVIKHLRFPNLQRVTIDVGTVGFVSLVSSIDDSRCSLTQLELHYHNFTNIDSDSVTAFLYNVPTLTTLTVRDPLTVPQFLHALVLREKSLPILSPNLTYLELHANNGNWDANLFTNILQSRYWRPPVHQENVKPLTSFHIYLGMDYHDWVHVPIWIIGSFESLEMFRELGMDISYHIRHVGSPRASRPDSGGNNTTTTTRNLCTIC